MLHIRFRIDAACLRAQVAERALRLGEAARLVVADVAPRHVVRRREAAVLGRRVEEHVARVCVRARVGGEW